jgi:outer membrane protein insertion porin family
MGAPPAVVLGYQIILDKEFKEGEYFWLAQHVEQDTRNHPVHTSRGHSWKLTSKLGIPTFNSNIGYYKVSLDTHWFTPLINEYSLVFHIHSYFGIAAPLGSKRAIPFDELYHIGGPRSVRGFLFGQIGPTYADDSIGATKAFFWNAELIFPVTPDMSIKGVVFYDGGGSFDAPYLKLINTAAVRKNNFDYRHAVGFGIRLLNPMPISIDWGFKIDPRKDRRDPSRNETSNEVHFGMSYGW